MQIEHAHARSNSKILVTKDESKDATASVHQYTFSQNLVQFTIKMIKLYGGKEWKAYETCNQVDDYQQ